MTVFIVWASNYRIDGIFLSYESALDYVAAQVRAGNNSYDYEIKELEAKS